ncbi:MAG: glycosyltransferase [Ignavibacteriae bacterium]|nr:glycosyltransferase [Ignavibacteriota bacterium]MCB9207948.1 glycosyltransferase [Ignavibacteriales bacterium]MCB9258717.1 glycosyltransferase [Ignavibacteriales bacterium]
MNPSGINLIWLTPEFPSNINDTKGVYLYRTVKELSKLYKITVICLYPAAPPIFEMLRYWKDWKSIYKAWKLNYYKNDLNLESSKNLKIIYLRYYRFPRSYFHHIEGWFAYLQGRKIISNEIESNSIIHANWIFPAGTFAKIISKKFKVPFLVSLMGSDVKRLVKDSIFWKNAKQLLLNANKVAAVTNDLFEQCKLLDIYIKENNKVLIDNIYESEKFTIKDRNETRKLLCLRNDRKYIFFAGGLIPVKNVHVLIEAFSQLLKNKINVSLLIAGAGAEEGNLKRLIDNLDIQNSVSFLGVLNSEKLISYYNASDIFCLPSKSEGLPNVAVESLFCGTPVVASSVGGIPTIIHEGKNGYLVEPNIPSELAEKLLIGLETNWKRDEIRKSISHLSKENVIKKYSQLYLSIAEN